MQLVQVNQSFVCLVLKDKTEIYINSIITVYAILAIMTVGMEPAPYIIILEYNVRLICTSFADFIQSKKNI